jgi:hypothetical protein
VLVCLYGCAAVSYRGGGGCTCWVSGSCVIWSLAMSRLVLPGYLVCKGLRLAWSSMLVC